jgi:hypothetical protein
MEMANRLPNGDMSNRASPKRRKLKDLAPSGGPPFNMGVAVGKVESLWKFGNKVW